jgi:hypothetical protein
MDAKGAFLFIDAKYIIRDKEFNGERKKDYELP